MTTAVHRQARAQIIEALKANTTFFIAGHLKPDGDVLGCALALSSLLKRHGKKVKVFSREPVPEYLAFLPGAKNIIVTDKVHGEFDCAIILECSDLDRMGNLISLEQATTVLNIDHHAVMSDYGDVNYVDSTASSSSEQVFNLFKQMGEKLNFDEAECLYVGLVTDTGKFQQTNTSPSCLRMAAELLEAGIEPSKEYNKLYATKSFSSLKLLGEALHTLSTAVDGKVAYMEVTHPMFRAAKSDASETEGIINYCMMLSGVMVGVLFRETETPGTIKASLRSRGKVDVNKVCRHFGGGGHKNAAGCSFKGTIASAKKELLDYFGELLK